LALFFWPSRECGNPAFVAAFVADQEIGLKEVLACAQPSSSERWRL